MLDDPAGHVTAQPTHLFGTLFTLLRLLISPRPPSPSLCARGVLRVEGSGNWGAGDDSTMLLACAIIESRCCEAED